MASPEENTPPDKNGNFFNKNPLITFAIFSVVVIMLFKAFIGDESDLAGKLSGQSVTRTQEVSYAELKGLINNKQVQKVAIGQTFIRAIGSDSNGKVAYTTRIVGPDQTLIALLDKQGIDYTGFSESNWFTEMFGWLFPFLIIIAIWMFFAGRMQKSMGGGILGMGSSKKLVNSEKPKTKFDDVAGVQ
ncbi:MAG: ATP-dependent metallopeptidase FtsH/Yme1/Tma family protein, partial [Sulfuricurvum sp.]|nr:ATP-dependent metallopeptidase FtsH/Yme1/Tma family protein [Sulfuricurvum sp.]